MSDVGVLVMPCQAYYAIDQSLVDIRIPCGIYYKTHPQSHPQDSDPAGLKVGP